MTPLPRIPSEAGHCRPSKLPRGPNGNSLCRKCGTECPGKRNTFCSSGCVHEWRLRTDTGYQARHVLERDKGVCESCGLDCVGLLDDLRELRSQDRREKWGAAKGATTRDVRSYGWEISDTSGALGKRCGELGLPQHLRYLTRRLWEMDHRVPVAEGGGSCGLENLRTLCAMCHRRETRDLKARLAERRRAEKAGPT